MNRFLFIILFIFLAENSVSQSQEMNDSEAIEASNPSLEEEQDTEKDTAFDGLEDTADNSMSDIIS